MGKKIEIVKESPVFIWFLGVSPFLLTMLAIIVEIAPVRFSYLSFIRPQISLIFVFLATVYFPESLGYFKVFFLGLLSDFLGFSLLGLNAFLFLLMYVLLSKYKNYLTNRSFVFVFFIFILFSLVETFIKALLIAIENNSFPPIFQVVMSYLLLLTFYPIAVYFCGKLNMYLIERDINVDK